MLGGCFKPSLCPIIGPFLVVPGQQGPTRRHDPSEFYRPLAEDPDFKAIGGLNRPGNMVLFVRFARLLEAAKGLLRTVNFLARDWSLARQLWRKYSPASCSCRSLTACRCTGYWDLHSSHGKDEIRMRLSVLTDQGKGGREDKEPASRLTATAPQGNSRKIRLAADCYVCQCHSRQFRESTGRAQEPQEPYGLSLKERGRGRISV